MKGWTLTRWAVAVLGVVLGCAALIVLGAVWAGRAGTPCPPTATPFSWPAFPDTPTAWPTATEWTPPGGTFTPGPAVTARPTSTLKPSTEAQLSAAETRVAVLEDALNQVVAVLASVMDVPTPLASYTPGPSRTPGPLPTTAETQTAQPTSTDEHGPTPTPDPWCRLCGDSTANPRYNCPPGFWCQLCSGGKYRCVRALSDCPKCDALQSTQPSARVLERGMWLDARFVMPDAAGAVP